jgi:hypothetical protein
LWRRSDLIAALRDVGPSVIITMTRVGNERPAEIACEAAAELFTLGFPCAFGIDPPDGVIGLDLHVPSSNDMLDLLPAPHVLSADSFAIATFDTARNGPFPVGRTHSQWLAAGLAVLLEAKIASGGSIISTLPPTFFAAIASAFVPWLLTGGTLQLAQGSSDQASFETGGAHLVAPATALNYLTSNVRDNFAAAIAIHRTPKSLSLDLSCANCNAIVDLQTFGEIGLSVLERIAKMMPSPIPFGPRRACPERCLFPCRPRQALRT